MNKIVYIAELDNDIDDVIAAEYLNNYNALYCVVLDQMPEAKEGIKRKNCLINNGIDVRESIPDDSKFIFVGGRLTLLAEFIKTHFIEFACIQGGFAGENVVEEKDILDKFIGKKFVRTFNFNCDIDATCEVLKSKNIDKIMLVGKNVCHSIINTEQVLWTDNFSKRIFKKYSVKENKRQHDMLMCHEGIVYMNNIYKTNFKIPINKSYCKYRLLLPINNGLNGNKTLWGSIGNCLQGSYHYCYVAIGYSDKIKKR